MSECGLQQALQHRRYGKRSPEEGVFGVQDSRLEIPQTEVILTRRTAFGTLITTAVVVNCRH